MRLLADENFPLASIRLLRTKGHDLVSISESTPGASDEEVLSQAVIEERILLTFDRDLGTLAFLKCAAGPPVWSC